MKIELFNRKHLELFDYDDDYNMILTAFEASLGSKDVVAFSIFAGDKVISICAVCKMWDGVAEVLTVMCKDVKKYGLSLYKAYKITLPTVFKSLELRRLQATVIVGFDEAVRFIEKLGFEREGVMRKWTPDGKDAYLYSLMGV